MENFTEFLTKTAFNNPIQVNRNTVRYEMQLPNGVIAYYNEVIPYNFLKKPYSYTYLNIQIKDEFLSVVNDLGGTLEDIYCSDGFGVPQFKDVENNFKCLESAYKFVTEHKHLFDNEKSIYQ